MLFSLKNIFVTLQRKSKTLQKPKNFKNPFETTKTKQNWRGSATREGLRTRRKLQNLKI
jgi:hypothetical protein